MVEFRWMETLLFVMSALLLTAAAQQQSVSSFIVREGDAVTLPCENVISGQVKCGLTTWYFKHFIKRRSVDVIKLRESRSDRVRVTADCSLAIKRVTQEDVGLYDCYQKRPWERTPNISRVDLSLVNTTEHTDADTVTLTCSLLTYTCKHTLRWLYNGTPLDGNTEDIPISSSSSSSPSYHCSITANFRTSNEKYKEQLKCEVRDSNNGEVRVFSFTHQSSECSTLTYIMLVVRVAEIILVTVLTALLIRATVIFTGNRRAPEGDIGLNTVRSRAVRRSGAAASQELRVDDGDVLNYENNRGQRVSVRVH
ncbi:uncharacterized protein LOC143004101 isoform X3 [Genypterus blacodes]|uniref:uncharacterized protein LOC143004101 isoform X3 n=1 Tax=Genypterus blacodes TaxID=154954 RepID=UPI003F764632